MKVHSSATIFFFFYSFFLNGAERLQERIDSLLRSHSCSRRQPGASPQPHTDADAPHALPFSISPSPSKSRSNATARIAPPPPPPLRPPASPRSPRSRRAARGPQLGAAVHVALTRALSRLPVTLRRLPSPQAASPPPAAPLPSSLPPLSTMAPDPILPVTLPARSLLTRHLAPRPLILRAAPPLVLPTAAPAPALCPPPQHIRSRQSLPCLPRRPAPHAVL